MDTTERLLTTYLANALWMTCLVAAAAMVVASLVHRGPSVYRHALWVMALAGACFLPLTGLRSGPVEIAGPVVVPVNAKDAIALSTGEKEAASHESFWLKMHRGRRPISLAPLLTQIRAYGYLGFVLCRGVCLVWAWRPTRRILRNACPCSLTPRHAAIVEGCCSSLCAGPLSMVCSGEVQSPVVLGVRRQVLVLPERFVSRSTAAELTSALCHELAHVRRHDFLLNLIYQAFWLPISFIPPLGSSSSRLPGRVNSPAMKWRRKG
jgi:beta-lactamase regulating signal transducer with metallopeptidase domain